MNTNYICSDIKSELKNGDSIEYRPDCVIENKLVFELRRCYKDNKSYLNVAVYPNEPGYEHKNLAELFDQKLRKIFQVI
jgi:hypothetical protein